MSRWLSDVEMAVSVRLLGLVPLLNFAYVFHFHASRGTLPELLWVCNVCSVVLGIGLLAARPVLVKTATVWLLVGAPLWAVEAARTDGWLAHSFVTHLLQPAIGLAVLRRLPSPRRTWWIALAMLATFQLAARFLSPPELNINLAHRVYPMFEAVFASYWTYWTVSVVLFAAALIGTEWAVNRVTR